MDDGIQNLTVDQQRDGRSHRPIDVSKFVGGQHFSTYLLLGWFVQLIYSLCLSYMEVGLPAFISKSLYTFSVLWFVGSAGYFVGMISGFLFGFPRGLNLPHQVGMQGRTRDNTNLEEISDWLTKIIVGLGLVNFRQMVEAIDRLGNFVGMAVALSPNAVGGAYIVAVTSALYGFACGFLFFYMWARSEFARFLNR